MASHRGAPVREHIAYQLLYELRDASVGRRTLVERTGLTESVVRTELEKLASQRLVVFSKLGTVLTERGQQMFLAKLNSVVDVREVRLHNLMLDRYSRMAQVRRAATGFQTWLYRDIAIREGATAALFLTKQNGAIYFIEEERPLAQHNPDDSRLLEQAFPQLRNGDLIVIVFGPARGAAARGLWAVLWALVSQSK